MNKLLDKIVAFFESLNDKVAKVMPGWKTKLTGAYIIMAGNVAETLGLLEAGQSTTIIEVVTNVLTNIETWVGTAVIYFRSLANRNTK